MNEINYTTLTDDNLDLLARYGSKKEIRDAAVAEQVRRADQADDEEPVESLREQAEHEAGWDLTGDGIDY